jgi:hypothetical protein
MNMKTGMWRRVVLWNFIDYFKLHGFRAKDSSTLSTNVLDIEIEVLSIFHLPFQENTKYFFQNSYLLIIQGHFPLYNVLCFTKYKGVSQHVWLLQREW